jgi:hypothetical protein
MPHDDHDTAPRDLPERCIVTAPSSAGDSTGPRRFTASVELVVEIDDPVTVAAFLLAGRNGADGRFVLPTAEQPNEQVRQIIDETLHEHFRGQRRETGLSTRVRGITVYGSGRAVSPER